MPPASSVILIILVTGAMASDIHRGRIYNCWLVPAFVTGIVMKLYACCAYLRSADGIRSILPELAHGVLPVPAVFILVLIPHLCGGLGAGDVKLITAGSVFLSFRENIICLAQAFLLAGLMVLFVLAEGLMPACRQQEASGVHCPGGIPFAVPYALSVIFMTGGVTDIFWQQV